MRTGDDKSPSNWPEELKYLRRPELSKLIDHSTRLTLASQGIVSNSAASSTRIRRIESATHPASGQYGLFAMKDLNAGQHIVDYLGRIHLPDTSDSDPDSDYDLSFRHGNLHLGIDAAKMGNESRMINDYRGIEGAPNAKFDSYVTHQGEIRMGVFVLGSEKKGGRGIKKGQEILISYGKGFWSNRTLNG
ncbi:Predicted protein [Taphrina deformans PYCC 5710]|uniref:SET domain-containing protein n=1 Tax=Taphrina deformans (strain PYCC 5710 / ATCC 11124 / CBS 356.35 / IMI 108563 / JCM 9778 / NBRC 8474) TaxID=1097556 RepID=R4XCH1_TAPDE|nr:Predicted protein [Taphrina deformans PYCC 5710]|eukprot:CCG83296.1 Predicted protein [Taphrina deformans PYCC 5710]